MVVFKMGHSVQRLMRETISVINGRLIVFAQVNLPNLQAVTEESVQDHMEIIQSGKVRYKAPPLTHLR